MRVKKRAVGFVLIFTFVLALGPAALADSPFIIEGGPLHWVLDGSPHSGRSAEYKELQIIRVGEEDIPLEFTLSDLEDDSGNKFPRELVVLDSPYYFAEQTWPSRYTQHSVLDRDHQQGTVRVGVSYGEMVRAGTYRGYLYPTMGEPIAVSIEVPRFTDVFIYPRELTIEADAGPNMYEANETVEIVVTANNSDWKVSLHSEGLFYQVPEKDRPKLWQEVSKANVKPVPLFFCRVDETEHVVPELQLLGVEYGGGTVVKFKVLAETDWEHPAGTYKGVIQVNVNIPE